MPCAICRDWILENTTSSIAVKISIDNLSSSDIGLYQPRVKLLHLNGTEEYVVMTPLLDLKVYDGKAI